MFKVQRFVCAYLFIYLFLIQGTMITRRFYILFRFNSDQRYLSEPGLQEIILRKRKQIE